MRSILASFTVGTLVLCAWTFGGFKGAAPESVHPVHAPAHNGICALGTSC